MTMPQTLTCYLFIKMIYLFSNPKSSQLVSTTTLNLTLSNFLIHFSNWAIQTLLSSTDSPRAYFETVLGETLNMWSVNQHTHTPFMLKQLQRCSRRVNSTFSFVVVIFLLKKKGSSMLKKLILFFILFYSV